MTQPYRAVLVGTGGIADAHLNAVKDNADKVTLVAAVDVNQASVDAFCERAGVPQAFTDYTTMLAEVKPDIVFIATPPGTHADMSIEAMEAGSWVLCEKPLCGSLAELDRIQAAEQATGRYTGCVFQMRFASSNLHLKQIAAEGLLGKPLVGVCTTTWYRDDEYYSVPWRTRYATAGGGPTMTLGVHAMDHFLDLFGDWTEVRAIADTIDRDIEVEDISMAIVRFANGAYGSIVNSALSPRQHTSIRLDYQQATVELNHLYAYSGENWTFTPGPNSDTEKLQAAWDNAPEDVGSTHGAQLKAFIANMEQGTPPSTSGNEARRTLELLTAIYKSAATDTTIRPGDIQPGDPYYAKISGDR